MHYARWRRNGGPAIRVTGYGLPLAQRIERFFARGEGCWLWTGNTSDGYGQIKTSGAMRYAHKVMYEMQIGPVPEGLFLDHICHVRNCVRPDHLRVVTTKQNLENLAGANRNNKTSGVRGVSKHKATGKWIAQTCHNYQKIYVGIFDTIEEAEAAVIAKRNELFTHNDADRTRV
jgi:hypothetical protein